jgi:hypothetical protein
MAIAQLAVALSVAVAALPVPATYSLEAGAPVASPDAKFCLRMEPITGTRIETIQCRTRAEWADLDVDLDHEWPANGVRVAA